MVETIYTDEDGFKLKFTDNSDGDYLDIQIEISDYEGFVQFYDIGLIEDLDAIIKQLTMFSNKFKEDNR